VEFIYTLLTPSLAILVLTVAATLPPNHHIERSGYTVSLPDPGYSP